jgi:hypothetical protein
VGFIAGGPELTKHPHADEPVNKACAVAASPPFGEAQGKLLAKNATNGAPGVKV